MSLTIFVSVDSSSAVSSVAVFSRAARVMASAMLEEAKLLRARCMAAAAASLRGVPRLSAARVALMASPT
jgi:hypothetical protein